MLVGFLGVLVGFLAWLYSLLLLRIPASRWPLLASGVVALVAVGALAVAAGVLAVAAGVVVGVLVVDVLPPHAAAAAPIGPGAAVVLAVSVDVLEDEAVLAAAAAVVALVAGSARAKLSQLHCSLATSQSRLCWA